jgi:hypothetical protein
MSLVWPTGLVHTTASSNTFTIAFVIVFGTETKDSWVKFWQFAKRVHPCLNLPQTTIITNQAKGSVEAICKILPLAKTFYYSYHHHQNIATFVKGGKGIRDSTPACGCTISS